MKKAIAIVLALTLASPVLGEGARIEGYGGGAAQKHAECTATGIAALFDERADGSNCPPTAGEKAVGKVLIFGTAVLIVGAASGKISFPLFN